MTTFTIESTYRIPIYRQRSYQADTLSEACRLAIEDDDCEGQKEDYEFAGETYVTGVWPGGRPALQRCGASDPIAFRRGPAAQGRALRGSARTAQGLRDPGRWRSDRRTVLAERAHAAIAKAEAILAGARDPDDEGGAS